MPSMICLEMRLRQREGRDDRDERLRDRMLWASPKNAAAISLRHQASLMRATPASVVSSTTSSTSRQNAYSAVIARRRAGGRKRKLR